MAHCGKPPCVLFLGLKAFVHQHLHVPRTGITAGHHNVLEQHAFPLQASGSEKYHREKNQKLSLYLAVVNFLQCCRVRRKPQ